MMHCSYLRVGWRLGGLYILVEELGISRAGNFSDTIEIDDEKPCGTFS